MNDLHQSQSDGETSLYEVAIVGMVGLPPRYGGFETLADQLVRNWQGSVKTLVFCSRPQQGDGPLRYHGADLEYLNWKANGWQSMIYDLMGLWRGAKRSRRLLVLGVSGCLALPLIRLRFPGVRIITNIDGLEWRRAKWGQWQRRVLLASEAWAVRFSHIVISDNMAIREYVQSTYGRDSQMIAYGGETLDARAQLPPPTRFAGPGYFLTICRIEPENNVEAILRAFSEVTSERLVMVGNWDVSDFSRQLRARFAQCPNIEMKDPEYDSGVLQSLRRHAKGYVHGHSAGGTNPSLVEAMHAGLFTLSFDVAYNRHTLSHLGLFWPDAAALTRLLKSADRSAWKTTAEQILQLAQREYAWPVIAERYRAVLELGDSAGR